MFDQLNVFDQRQKKHYTNEVLNIFFFSKPCNVKRTDSIKKDLVG